MFLEDDCEKYLWQIFASYFSQENILQNVFVSNHNGGVQI